MSRVLKKNMKLCLLSHQWVILKKSGSRVQTRFGSAPNTEKHWEVKDFMQMQYMSRRRWENLLSSLWSAVVFAERPDKGMIAFLFELENGYTCHFRDIRGMIVIGRKLRPPWFLPPSALYTWKLSIKSATYYKDMSDHLFCGTTLWSTQIGMNVSPACTTPRLSSYHSNDTDITHLIL